MTAEPTDARRVSGERTRARLLAAARHLLAAGDGGEVTLRAITAAAEANVAAVSYHFGSKDELCREAVDGALREVVHGQLERYRLLDDGATLDDLALAYVAPVIAALATQDADARALLRIAARVASGRSYPRQASGLTRGIAELTSRLHALLPELDETELLVRVEAAGALVRAYADGPLEAVLEGRPVEEIERLLVPVITGVWRGGAAAR